ncbi:MAG: hypothetical protein H0U87_10490, partial [Acidobacteria bacterium]|nr:hypothetical protein [Acidobacteriota bacterium]
LLPKRVARVLSSEIELTGEGESLKSMAKKSQPVVREVLAAENEGRT